MSVQVVVSCVLRIMIQRCLLTFARKDIRAQTRQRSMQQVKVFCQSERRLIRLLYVHNDLELRRKCWVRQWHQLDAPASVPPPLLAYCKDLHGFRGFR